MNASESQDKQLLPKFSRADVIAFIALLISLAALAVSIYEAQILRDQQSIMRLQQKASVLPYLVQHENYSFSSEGNEYVYALENKGIGAARISKVRATIHGTEVRNYGEVQDELRKIFPKEVQWSLSFRNPLDYFLSEKEDLVALTIQTESFGGDYDLIHGLDIHFEICYCSIYEDCWRLEKEHVMPKEGCFLN